MSQADSSIASLLMAEPIFKKCPGPDLARLLPHTSERLVEAGEELHTMGEKAANLYLIISGGFRVGGADKGSGQGVVLQSGFLGEEAAIGMGTYVATATATESSRVLSLPADAVRGLSSQAAFKERMMASFGGRFLDSGKEHVYKDWDIASKLIESPRLLIGWLLALLAPVGVISFFTANGALPNEQSMYLLAIISATVVMWIFRLLPDFIPALFAVLCSILLGVATPEVAMRGFASDSFFMALSILALSAVISISGLSYRMLLWLLRIGPAHKLWYTFSLFITGVFLTPIIPTTNGRIAILTPFLTDLLGALDRESAKREATRLSMSVITGVSLFSAIFLSSKSVNFVVFGMLPPQEQFLFQWLYWLYAASVCGGVLMVLYWVCDFLLFRNPGRPSIPKHIVMDQMRIIGPVTAPEWAGIIGLVALMLSFLTAALHRIDVPWVALAILFSLLMFGFLGKSEFRQKIDWSFLFFLGALIGLVGIIRQVGLDVWLTSNMGWLGTYMGGDFFTFAVMIAGAMFVVRLALPINATVIVFVSLLIPIALHIGFNPWLVGFIVLLFSESFVWPYQASYYTQFLSLAGPSAGTEDRRVVFMHILLFFCKLAAIYISIPFWKSLGII